MPNSIHNTPGQARMSNSPPGTPPDEDTGKGKINHQPDYTSYGYPVDERNNNNPVPWVVLPSLFDECQHDGHSQTRITQWVNEIDNAPEPFSVCLHFQFALLSTLPLVRQVAFFFGYPGSDSNRSPGYRQVL